MVKVQHGKGRPKRKYVTIKEMIRRVFPEGSNGTPKAWDASPEFPPDVFAVAAFLLERSGTYVFLSPGERHLWKKPWFHVDPPLKEEWQKAAKEWRKQPITPPIVQSLWDDLYKKNGEAEFTKAPDPEKPTPEWVIAAYGLMYIADEACGDVGYLHQDQTDEESSWIALIQLNAEIENIKSSTASQADATTHVRIKQHQNSVTQHATPDLLAVQPKSHTAQLGLSLRAITQNLALLPPPSRMSATWNRRTGNVVEQEGLTVLMVPFPYHISSESVRAELHGDPTQPSWGWFDVDQTWLPEKEVLFKFVSNLMRAAGKVDVLVFPELSLSWDHHEYLVDNLARDFPELEFVVSGSKTNCDQQIGNFALTSSINWTPDNNYTIHTNSRGKHHRWRLDDGQIKSYDLSANLPEATPMWWEKISVARRIVHTHVFRNNSCFTTFICEDLARSDPAHEAVRAIGPSIVFCLLMDGPQIATRWSARYALGLVEDPGSAVLTFTSRGLMQRTRDKALRDADKDLDLRSIGKSYPRAENWSVGLWRDSKKGAIELHCPPPDHAIVLTLTQATKTDYSYDGRVNTDGVSWHYESSRNIRLKDDDPSLIELMRKGS